MAEEPVMAPVKVKLELDVLATLTVVALLTVKPPLIVFVVLMALSASTPPASVNPLATFMPVPDNNKAPAELTVAVAVERPSDVLF